jgi:hypothetical protein
VTLTNEDVIEIGRALGWEYALNGINPGDNGLPSVTEGYVAGKAKYGIKPRSNDRFVRKFLQMRLNALRRRKLVDSSVDVDFLKKIDHKTCPVTLLKLTYGQMKDTDWSIDRVNNSGGYSIGNLMVLSTRANKAKGDKSFEDVFALYKHGKEIDGLSPREWLRMSSLMFSSYHAENPDLIKYLPLPLATRIPAYSVRSVYSMLQRLVLDASKSSSNRQHVRGMLKSVHGDKNSFDKFDAIVQIVISNKKRTDYEYDVFVDDHLQNLLFGWLQSLPPGNYQLLKDSLNRHVGGESTPRSFFNSWSLETKGKF